jgi:hypothetical protein
MGSASAAGTAFTQNNATGNSAFLMALQSVVSQLNVFVQLVDAASKACIRGPRVTYYFLICHHRFIHMPTSLGK